MRQAVNSSPIGIDPTAAPRFVDELYQAQPNPANPAAMIRYSISQPGEVRLRIFGVGGRLVRTLVDEIQEPAATRLEAPRGLRPVLCPGKHPSSFRILVTRLSTGGSACLGGRRGAKQKDGRSPTVVDSRW